MKQGLNKMKNPARASFSPASQRREHDQRARVTWDASGRVKRGVGPPPRPRASCNPSRPRPIDAPPTPSSPALPQGIARTRQREATQVQGKKRAGRRARRRGADAALRARGPPFSSPHLDPNLELAVGLGVGHSQHGGQSEEGELHGGARECGVVGGGGKEGRTVMAPVFSFFVCPLPPPTRPPIHINDPKRSRVLQEHALPATTLITAWPPAPGPPSAPVASLSQSRCAAGRARRRPAPPGTGG